MNEKVMLGEFIYRLRKEKGYSQTELGEMVGVSNKAVSKWETDEANPELGLIEKLAKVLGVTADELLACKRSEKAAVGDSGSLGVGCMLGIKGKVTKTPISYEFVSEKKTKKGTPYVHINLGKYDNGKVRRAKGIFAVGIISKGIVSLGLVSAGLLSIGLLSVGLLAIGLFSIGLIAAVGGVLAISFGAAVGSVAIGSVAVGAVAIGILSVGAVSIGVFAHTGIKGIAIGFKTFFHK